MFHWLHNPRRRKTGLSILTGFFLVFELFGALAFARPANAQVVQDLILEAAVTKKEVETTISTSLLAAGMSSVVNAASFLMRKLAYDTA
ncbi:MAG: hypothetical protein AAB932_00920, partial [Patescibacteria group bacterium]